MELLVDHHCHGVVRRDLDRATFESWLTEADGPAPGTTLFDSALGEALREHCFPLLGAATPAEYLGRRAELGHAEVARRLLRAAGLAAVLVDTGFAPEPLTAPAELGALAGAASYEVVRLEAVAEGLAPGVTASGFGAAVRDALATAAARPATVAFKSVAAYRVGLALRPERPSVRDVAVAAGRWLAGGGGRLADETLHRFLAFAAVDTGLPVQFHTGLGDRDVDLRACDPLLLAPWLRAVELAGVPVLLLHCYPYQRNAGYLAQVFPAVHLDLGLATHNVGARAGAVLAEALELCPYGKFLYSSDGFALPELHFLGAALFRAAAGADLARRTTENAHRVYPAVGGRGPGR
ncbi:amidohydrolase family protein [Asanoa siamensis]|uniref:Amidohydrolase n=1 Tax=Asanoa siamensis TaxID=926357 RepID=A0ABQ4CK49_9ACTN|nr:amidohydrolase family protein [Asanoa siamensis]GIF71672.1 amidohydrolase [Asanoa siamensis]